MTTTIAFSRQNDTGSRARAQKRVLIVASSSLYNLQVSIFISDHGKSWRIAGNITQRGSFEPDESQVVLQFYSFLLALFWSFNMALSRAKTFARPKRTPALQAMFCLNPSATQRNYQVFNIENILFFLFFTF